uniref:N-terminal amino-acid N(alpha)-acetyltransferase NatA n=1 Tax=Parastrongyloides trichosuri TaxID=131310 RepID=A0A0N4ZIM4_PARTI
MISIRQARIDDMLKIQHCNQQCLPEHYKGSYYKYVLLGWPTLSFVAEDDNGKIIGYVMVKIDEEGGDDKKGFITSLSVARPYRKLGIGETLLRLTSQALVDNYGATSVILQVRISNKNAINLYCNKLNFEKKSIIKEYYTDGEDAHLLSKDLAKLERFDNPLK